MADITWDYVAGFIDGEGSFTIASQKYYFHPRLSISQNTRNVLEEIQEFFLSYGIRSHLYDDVHKPRGNPWFNLRTNDRDSLLRICEYLEGKLHVKHRQLDVIRVLLTIPSGDTTRTDINMRHKRYEHSQMCREKLMCLNQER